MDRASISQPALIPNEIQRRGETLVRTLPISLLPVFAGLLSGLLIRFLMGGAAEQTSNAPHRSAELLVGLAVAVILFTALIMLARLGRPTISVVVFISIWTLVTTLATIENGVTTFWPALLIMPICAAGLLLDGVASAARALLDTLPVAVPTAIQRQELSASATQPALFSLINRPIFAAGFLDRGLLERGRADVVAGGQPSAGARADWAKAVRAYAATFCACTTFYRSCVFIRSRNAACRFQARVKRSFRLASAR